MTAIAWAMWMSWWRGALALAVQPTWCIACGKPGHVSADCPDTLWGPGRA